MGTSLHTYSERYQPPMIISDERYDTTRYHRLAFKLHHLNGVDGCIPRACFITSADTARMQPEAAQHGALDFDRDTITKLKHDTGCVYNLKASSVLPDKKPSKSM